MFFNHFTLCLKTFKNVLGPVFIKLNGVCFENLKKKNYVAK